VISPPVPWWTTVALDKLEGSDMTNEAEKNPQQQKQQQGSNASNVDPSQGNQGHSNPELDISKKNPSQDSDSRHKCQQKPEDEKRRAS
jgi:hypothetical protein